MGALSLNLSLSTEPTPTWAGELSTFVTLVVPDRQDKSEATAQLARLQERLFHDYSVITRGVHEVVTSVDDGVVTELMSTHVVSLLATTPSQSEGVWPIAALPILMNTFIERLELRMMGYTVDAVPVAVRRSSRPWQDFCAGDGPRVLVRSKPLPVKPRMRFPLQLVRGGAGQAEAVRSATPPASTTDLTLVV